MKTIDLEYLYIDDELIDEAYKKAETLIQTGLATSYANTSCLVWDCDNIIIANALGLDLEIVKKGSFDFLESLKIAERSYGESIFIDVVNVRTEIKRTDIYDSINYSDIDVEDILSLADCLEVIEIIANSKLKKIIRERIVDFIEKINDISI